ncbi:MAG: beta-propeller fold lactonase family protein [Acidobacteriota bacterium]
MRVAVALLACLLILMTLVLPAPLAVQAGSAALPVAFQTVVDRSFIYVNNNDFENSVSAFRLLGNARLEPVSGSPFSTGGIGGKTSDIGSLTICRSRALLYITNNADNSVTGFRINPDGKLTRLPGTPISTGGRFPAGVVCNTEGTRLFVANIESDSIAAFTINSNGALQPLANSPFRVSNGPISLAINNAGTVLFAGHQFNRSIGSYSIDTTGALRQTGNFSTLGTVVHGLALHTPSARLYVAELGSNSISGFRVDLNSGMLALLPNVPYFTDGDRPIDITVSPNGNLVFVSNNNTSSITVFSVNSDGSLRAVPGSPFTTDGDGPAGLTMNSAGTLLFVANGGFGGSKDVSVYQVDSSGQLRPVLGSPFSTGSIGIPSAIGIFEFPPPPKITKARFAMKKRRLTIDGSSLAPSPEVTINGKLLRPSRLFSVTDSQIVLAGMPEKLNLRSGDNNITVSILGQISNTFILKQ